MTGYQEIDGIRRIIIEALGQTLDTYGMNRTIGYIYGLLYFEDNPLCLDEIAEKLGVSKATVSINIRLLLKLKMVQKIWMKGSRKDYYLAERDFNKIFQEALKSKELNQIRLIKEAIVPATKSYQDLMSRSSQEVKQLIEGDLKKIEELIRIIQLGEKWIYFLLDKELDSGPFPQQLKEIAVDWGVEG